MMAGDDTDRELLVRIDERVEQIQSDVNSLYARTGEVREKANAAEKRSQKAIQQTRFNFRVFITGVVLIVLSGLVAGVAQSNLFFGHIIFFATLHADY